MSEPKYIDDIMPSAAPTDDEIRRWQALPVEEQRKRLEKAVLDGFNSGISDRSIEDIIADCRKKIGLDCG